MDCQWLSNDERMLVSEWTGALNVLADKLHSLASSTWQNYGSVGRPTPSRDATDLTVLMDTAQQALMPAYRRKLPHASAARAGENDYRTCIDTGAVLNLRKSVAEAFLVGFGQDPAGWVSAWARVWPNVPAPQYALPTVPAKAKNKAQFKSDLKAVAVLVRGATTALEKQDIAWAKSNIDAVRAILVDGSGTLYVHAARAGAAAPQGVLAAEFDLLKKAAQALYDMLPKLAELAAKKLSGGFIVMPPMTLTPVQPDDDGILECCYEWVKEHPWLSAAGIGTAGYLAWRTWGKR